MTRVFEFSFIFMIVVITAISKYGGKLYMVAH